LITIAFNGQLNLNLTNNAKPLSVTKQRNLVSLLINSTKANANNLIQFASNAHQRMLAKPQNASMTKITPLLADVQPYIVMMQTLALPILATQRLENAFIHLSKMQFARNVQIILTVMLGLNLWISTALAWKVFVMQTPVCVWQSQTERLVLLLNARTVAPYTNVK
jgi:uncharacterized membrane protein